MSGERQKRVGDLQPGDMIDIDGLPGTETDDYAAAEFELATVEKVKDSFRDSKVYVYLDEYPSLWLNRDRMVTWAGTKDRETGAVTRWD